MTEPAAAGKLADNIAKLINAMSPGVAPILDHKGLRGLTNEHLALMLLVIQPGDVARLRVELKPEEIILQNGVA